MQRPAELQLRRLRPDDVPRGEEQQTALETTKQNLVGPDSTAIVGSDMETGSPDGLLRLQAASVPYPSTEETTHLSTEWLQQITPESSLHMPLAMVLDEDAPHQSTPDLDLISELISYSTSDVLWESYLEPMTVPPLSHSPRKSSSCGRNSPLVSLCPGQPRHWGEDWSSQMRLSLQQFEQTLNSREPWNTGSTESSASSIATPPAVDPITDTTRDNLLVVTQLLLMQTRNVHSREHSSHGRRLSPLNLTIVTLPPAKALDDLLRAQVSCFEQYFGLSSGEVQDPNTLMNDLPHDVKAAGIMLLLMIAIGATASPAPELHIFATGLTETCRTALSDMMEGDMASTRPDIVSHCALLLLYLGMWSGERWLMRVSPTICRMILPFHVAISSANLPFHWPQTSCAHRQMYTQLLHRKPPSLDNGDTPSLLSSSLGLNQQWAQWKEEEMNSRLTYAWVIADQEWSLFYDTPLSFSVDTLTESLPADDRLWKAGSESDWARLAPEAFATQPPICLRDLYTCFMNGELRPGRGTRLPLQYLRLLLVPLHGMVCHLRQWLQSFPNCPVRWRKSTQGLSNPAIHAQLDQVQALLPEWFNLAVHSANTNSPAGLAMLVMYHLIALNAMASFPSIEAALLRGPPARPEAPNPRGSGPCPLGACPATIAHDSEEEALVHCGQILRLVRLMPPADQPLWWSAVVYRVALITMFLSMKRHPHDWLPALMLGPVEAASLASSSATSSSSGTSSSSIISMMSSSASASVSDRGATVPPQLRSVVLNDVPADHPALLNFIKYKEGEPVLADRDGQLVELRRPREVLRLFIDLADVQYRPVLRATRFQASVKDSLEQLADLWGYLSPA
ncbi:uncharacterized protein BO66DRAFT_101836 [Aspergillus aculeatinus CBS 121060]|uniref:Uncharacterized protein n=1 Tax=Aspergillus aculeatinus CBS 121060 TaxID=1448322 RepID=A0ACD1H7L2_9EURO|nr:hypothetical protein BO66DRAFT_101836 [Aspergillus aculeatinus CBS 121060]RAH69497.1 hypothetical protein BO66DRAFT_101836 [Aspergillus aculeatinus CBS 121060]